MRLAFRSADKVFVLFFYFIFLLWWARQPHPGDSYCFNTIPTGAPLLLVFLFFVCLHGFLIASQLCDWPLLPQLKAEGSWKALQVKGFQNGSVNITAIWSAEFYPMCLSYVVSKMISGMPLAERQSTTLQPDSGTRWIPTRRDCLPAPISPGTSLWVVLVKDQMAVQWIHNCLVTFGCYIVLIFIGQG